MSAAPRSPHARGAGPGEITDDGCAVEVHRRLPPAGEAGLVHAAVPGGAAVLDLGCGTGRIARPLAALGHRVVGVDASSAMLAELGPSVEGVFARLRPGATHSGALGEVHTDLEGLGLADGVLTAVVRHAADGLSWEQWFTAAVLTEQGLDDALAAAGPRRTAWLTDDRGWWAAAAR